ncbi:MAG: hypothetical protein MUC65_10715, partial [Pontiellaceae bacterium]|nr:hypothetical protein [Pontiellaceae bacterium]
MLGYVAEVQDLGGTVTNAVTFACDPNGARTNKTETVSTTSTVSTNLTRYSYDPDNRLLTASTTATNSTALHTFAYDYRSRR